MGKQLLVWFPKQILRLTLQTWLLSLEATALEKTEPSICCQQSLWSISTLESAEASQCGKGMDSRIAETYLKTYGRTESEGLVLAGPGAVGGGGGAKAVAQLTAWPEGAPLLGRSVQHLPWYSQLDKAVQRGAGCRLLTFIFLWALTLSLGVVTLMMLPSFAVCSGDVTTESYM